MRNFRNALVFFSSISLGPYWASRFCASACVRPSGDDPNFFSTSARGRDFRSSFASGFVMFMAFCAPARAIQSFASAQLAAASEQPDFAMNERYKNANHGAHPHMIGNHRDVAESHANA